MTRDYSPLPIAAAGLAPGVLAALQAALARRRFGVVQLIVHDGRIVQLDVTEKQRF